MNSDDQSPQERDDAALMTETLSVRLTQEEREALEKLAEREERTISNYVRKHLRIGLFGEKER